jgi:hypothetical protein
MFKLIQILANFDLSKKDLSELTKFEIKYGHEWFEEKNKFLRRKFSKFEMDFK